MATFLALYRGDSISAAKLIALTAESSLVGEFAARMLTEPEEPEADPVFRELKRGRRQALELVKSERP